MTLMETVKYQDYQKEDSQNSKLLKEIKDQSKHLHLMQEYINLLENKMKNYNFNYNLQITKEIFFKLSG